MTPPIRIDSITKRAVAVALLAPLLLAAGCSTDSISTSANSDATEEKEPGVVLMMPENSGYDSSQWAASEEEHILDRAHGQAPFTESFRVDGEYPTQGTLARLVLYGSCEPEVNMTVTARGLNSEDDSAWDLECAEIMERQTVVFDPKETIYDTIDVTVTGNGKWGFMFAEAPGIPQSE